MREHWMPLRAGVPLTVVAEIGARRRIVGLVSLHAVSDRIVARRRRDRDRSVIVIAVIVVAIARPVIAIARRGQRAADHRTGNRAGDEAATVPS